MNYPAEYQSKLCTPDEAVKLIKDGDWLDYTHGISFPQLLDQALAKRKGELHDVKVRGMLCLQPLAIIEKDPRQESFTYNSWYCTGIERAYIDQGKAYFIPAFYHDISTYYNRGLATVDVVMLSVNPMDKNGNFTFSFNPSCNGAIVRAAKKIIVEVNPNLPHCTGLCDDSIHISQVTAIVESNEAVPTAANPVPTAIDRQIAANIFPYLEDNITLQIGVGGIPNVLGSLIADSDLKDLGMHTEYFSDGYVRLYEAGKITDRKKESFPGRGVFASGAGSQKVYDFLDDNAHILSAPIDYVNDPQTIRKFDHFVSINGCLNVDLYGQVCSEAAGTRHISGSGGQVDFISGALLSPHGKAFLALPSTFTDKKGQIHSRILPYFTDGSIITTPRAQAPYIVTEYGAAQLSGLATWQRAEALIKIAHPDFREGLIQAAEKQKIWRRSNKK